MTAALALPTATFQFPAETPLNIGVPLRQKLNLARQFVRSAAATTTRMTRNVGTHVKQNWKPMAAGMVAGAGFQIGVKALTAQFAAAGLATVLPGAAVTIIGGAVAGAGVVMVKKGVDTYFYNLAHKDDKKSYLKELTNRDTVIKALTGGVGGAIGAQILANNPVIMDGLQSMGHKTAVIASAIGGAVGRRVSEAFAGTALHNVLSREGRKSFREAFFSKQALLGTALGAVGGFVGAEAVNNYQAVSEVLRSPGKLASSINLSSITEKAGSTLSRVAGGAGSVLSAIFGISSANAQAMPGWFGHAVPCPPSVPAGGICIKSSDMLNVLPPSLRQGYINDEIARGRNPMDFTAPATNQPLDQVRAGQVPTLDDARRFVRPGNAPLTGTPRPIDQIRNGDVPTVLDDPRNMVTPRNLQRNGLPRPIDQVRVGDAPTVLDDARNFVPPVNASTGSRGVVGNEFTSQQSLGRVASAAPVGADPAFRYTPPPAPGRIAVEQLPPLSSNTENPANIPVGRYGYLPPDQEAKVLAGLREGKDAATAVKLATEAPAAAPLTPNARVQQAFDAIRNNGTAPLTAATLTPNARVQQAFGELHRHSTAPAIHTTHAPTTPVNADAISRLPEETQAKVQKAFTGALPAAASMHVLKEASFELINKQNNPAGGTELLRRGVEISQAKGLAGTPTGQQLSRDLAYMDGQHPKTTVAAAPLPVPPPLPVEAPSGASNVTPLIAPEVLAHLSKDNQLALSRALSGQASPREAIRAFKDASFELINKHHNPEAGMDLLRRGVALSHANNLDKTDVGFMLRRDLADMERITGAARPAAHSSVVAPLAAKAA